VLCSSWQTHPRATQLASELRSLPTKVEYTASSQRQLRLISNLACHAGLAACRHEFACGSWTPEPPVWGWRTTVRSSWDVLCQNLGDTLQSLRRSGKNRNHENRAAAERRGQCHCAVRPAVAGQLRAEPDIGPAKSTWGWSVTTLHCKPVGHATGSSPCAGRHTAQNPRQLSLSSQPYNMPVKSQLLIQFYSCRPVALSSFISCQPRCTTEARCLLLALSKTAPFATRAAVTLL